MRQYVQIIGGKYRGKKISFPPLAGLRPTPNRVRETVFNWLMHAIRDARCLDAFAGSGALGFEAYSRGAAHVVLVEKATAAYLHLKEIALSFKTNAIDVVAASAETYLQRTREQFDIIFLDPPFQEQRLYPLMEWLLNSNLLVPGGLVYVESPVKLQVNPQQWHEKKLKQTGQVIYALYEKL